MKFIGPNKEKKHFILNEKNRINLKSLSKFHIKFGIIRNENILSFNLIQTGDGKGTDTLKLVILKRIPIVDIDETGAKDKTLINYYIFYNLYMRIKKEDFDIIFGPMIKNFIENEAFKKKKKKLGINTPKETSREKKLRKKKEKKAKKKKEEEEETVTEVGKHHNLEKKQIIRYFDDKREVMDELLKDFI